MMKQTCVCQTTGFSERNCTGCRACGELCPAGAISFSENAHGFLMPAVDGTKCTGCGVCAEVCHLRGKKAPLLKKENLASFAAKAKDSEIRMSSSSGGIFSVLAKRIIDAGGAVYGAAFDRTFSVRHIRAGTAQDLEALHGSKYVQSDLNDCLHLAAEDVAGGHSVLFSGTPCQIAAVQSYFSCRGISADKLITTEVICHGVPSPLVWREYIASRIPFPAEDIRNVYFRHKKDGWHARIKVRAEASHVPDLFEDSDFTELFLADLTLRECCHECPYATRERTADISLCDFWGIENTNLKVFDDDKGVSGVILHSQKALELWHSVADDVESMTADLEDIARNQKTMNAPFPRPENKKAFWTDFYTKPFSSLPQKYVDGKYRIQSYKYIVVASDGSGSKGDEGMLRGLLSLLDYDNILLVSPNAIYPCTDSLLDIKDRIDEVCVPHEEISDAIKCRSALIVIGADVIDGTCGVEYSLSRLEAMKKMLSLGGEVFCFSSFRSDVDPQIIAGLNDIASDKNARFFVRDETSLENFRAQVRGPVEFFPDFAFFCERKTSEEVSLLKDFLCRKREEGFKLIGINFSAQSFMSFYKEKTLENRVAYVTETLRVIQQEEARPFFILLSNDIREWEEHLSDSSYQVLAENSLKRLGCGSFLTVSSEISYPELLELLSSLDYIISARMHLSIAAMRCGTIPVIYTGNGSAGSFSMTEKVEGMLRSRIGRTDLLAGDKNELVAAIRVISSEYGQLKETLAERNRENSRAEEMYASRFQEMLCVRDKKPGGRTQEIFAAKDIIRKLRTENWNYRNMSREFDILSAELNNKNGHITQLIESERELNGRISEKDRLLQDCNRQILELSSQIHQRDLHIQDLDRQICGFQEHIRNIEAQVHDRDEQIHTLEAQICVWDEQLRNRDEQLRNQDGQIHERDERISDLDEQIEGFLQSKSWRVTKPLRFTKRCVRAVYRLLVPKKLRAAIWNFRHKGTKAPVVPPAPQAAGEKPEFDPTLPEPITYRPVLLADEPYTVHELPVSENPLVSIIIPVYNQFAYTYKCIRSILALSDKVAYEIIIGDDLSTDETKDITSWFPGVRVNRNETDHGFLMNCKRAAKLARGKYILFLNNDTQVQDGWLESLVRLIESDEKIGMAGSKLVYPDGRLQEAGGIIWRDASGWNYGRDKNPELPEYNYVKEADYISGASIIIRSSLWNEIGGFDERYKPAYYEDSDFAFEVRKHGYKVMYQPQSVVVHFEGVSNGTDLDSGLKKYQVENRDKFVAKWAKQLKKQYSDEGDAFLARERNFGKKVILIIDHYVPTFDKDAGSKTTFQYIKMFMAQGYCVKFVGDNFARWEMEPYMSTLLQMGVEVLYGVWYSNNILSYIKQHEKHIDFVYLNRPHITAKYIDFIRNETNIKILYYGHDLHFFRMQREYELTGNPNLLPDIEHDKQMELDVMRKSDVVYYPSYLEERAIKNMDPSINVKAIHAYIFDTSKLCVQYNAADRSGILFVGGFSHTPNVDAIKWFAREIFPSIRAKNSAIDFYIAGSNAPDEIKALDGNGIIFKGFVTEEELARLYASCRIVVVPLRYGAGVKGKVVEALYNGTPIVTTDIGAEGIEGIEGIAAIHNEAEAFSDAVLRLYDDGDRLRDMSWKSIEFIKENFSMEAAWNVVKGDFA